MSELKTNLDEILQEKQNKIIPENIKKDIQIFDVIGTYEGSGGGIDTSSDNPITADDVAQGKEGFVNGEKVIGNAYTVESGGSAIAINSPYTYKTGPVEQLQIYGQAPTWSDGQTSTLFKQGSQTFISILKEEQPDLANAISLTPEKLVKGNTILGIEGIAEASVGAKLFETQEEMQADSSAKEGDLAVVYREEIQNMTSDTQTQYITFPETVTLPTAQGGFARGNLIAVDGGSFIDQATYSLTSSTFSFNMYASSGMIQVQYESTDGITYTRTLFDTLENPVDLGMMMTPEGTLPDNCGYFMQVGGNVFEGLFEYSTIDDTNNIAFYPLENFSFVINEEHRPVSYNLSLDNPIIFNYEKISQVAEKFKSSTGLNIDAWYVNTNNELCIIADAKNNYIHTLVYDWDANLLGITGNNSSAQYSADIYQVNLDDLTYNKVNTLSSNDELYITLNSNSIKKYYIPIADMKSIPLTLDNSNMNFIIYVSIGSKEYIADYILVSYNSGYLIYPKKNVYILAPSQLNATKDSVYNSTYYGKDGIEEGTLTQNVSNSFTDINADVYSKIQQAYDNMQPRILTDSDKKIDKNIYVIPIKSDGTPLLDTSQVTDMYIMFVSCTNLQSIPLLDTSKVTNMRGMFNGCTNLTTISLLNTSQVTHMGNMFSNCTSLTNIPLLDTSNVTTMYSMFSDCTNLQSVPLLDTSNVTTMNGMFSNCENLSNESLNNILQMCINAIKVPTSNKTLKFIGLSETQAQTCTTLSNYSAFTAAGWTTGY